MTNLKLERITDVWRSLRFSALRRVPPLYFAWLCWDEWLRSMAPEEAREQPIRKPSLDDGEYETLDSARRYTIVNCHSVELVTKREERMAWLEPVFKTIDDLLGTRPRVSVHEIGCGSTGGGLTRR